MFAMAVAAEPGVMRPNTAEVTIAPIQTGIVRGCDSVAQDEEGSHRPADHTGSDQVYGIAGDAEIHGVGDAEIILENGA